jgi:molybdopterin-synthase adenylyltransferase
MADLVAEHRLVTEPTHRQPISNDGSQCMGQVGVELRGGVALESARSVLLSSSREELIAAFGRFTRTVNGILFLVAETEQAPEDLVWRDADGLHWEPDLTKRWTNRAEEAGRGVVLMHAHGGEGSVRLSPIDERTCMRMLDHFAQQLEHQASGYVVVGRNAATGRFVVAGDRMPLTALKTVTCPIRKWGPDPAAIPPAPPAMARQVAAIADLGQARLASATVAIVGVGGGGSDVADQLAHMRVGHVILCDADIVKDVNLSRQRAAGPSNLGASKVQVMAAAIRHANPDVRITVLLERFPDVDSHTLLRDADVIVCSVDGAAARDELNKFGRRFLVPLIDIGATIRRDHDQVHSIVGHMARLLPDGACMECEGLTSRALREKQRAGRDVPYFEGHEPEGAPQVISVNGVLASLAVTEVLRLVAGLTEDRVSLHWRYDALRGEVYARDPITTACSICKLFARGDESMN